MVTTILSTNEQMNASATWGEEEHNPRLLPLKEKEAVSGITLNKNISIP